MAAQAAAASLNRHQSEVNMLEPVQKGKRCFKIGGAELIIVDERYNVTQMIGSGAYGLVFAAHDSKTGEEVAIKKINTAFDSVVDAKRILREIKILSKYQHFTRSDVSYLTMCSLNDRIFRPREHRSVGRHPATTPRDRIQGCLHRH